MRNAAPMNVAAICALLLALPLPSAAAAQLSSPSRRDIRGSIVNLETGSGLAGVRISLTADVAEPGDGVETVSDAEGGFVLKSVRPGRYRLSAHLDGFDPYDYPQPVEVRGDAEAPPLEIAYPLRMSAEISTRAPVPESVLPPAAGTTMTALPGRAIAATPGGLEDVMRVFQSRPGRPYTPFDRTLSIRYGGGYFDRSRLNLDSYPSYQRLDVRVDRTFALRGTALTAYLEVENLYDHDNVYLYEWSRSARASKPVYQWGRLPVAGVRWQF